MRPIKATLNDDAALVNLKDIVMIWGIRYNGSGNRYYLYLFPDGYYRTLFVNEDVSEEEAIFSAAYTVPEILAWLSIEEDDILDAKDPRDERDRQLYYYPLRRMGK